MMGKLTDMARAITSQRWSILAVVAGLLAATLVHLVAFGLDRQNDIGFPISVISFVVVFLCSYYFVLRLARTIEAGRDTIVIFDSSESIDFRKRNEPYPAGVIGVQKVMFATNRRISDGIDGARLDPEQVRWHWQTWLYYGRAWVTIPESHKIGFVERPRRTWESLWLIKEKEDPAKHFTLADLTKVSDVDFYDEVSKASNKSALVFVHGFNVSFVDAIFRAAQIGYDTNFRGEVIAFCWPSRASLSMYDADRERALASDYALLDLLHRLRTKAGVSNIFLIAHSLGSQIAVGALSAIPSRIGEGKLKIEEVVLGAPDVDRDVFVASADRVKSAAEGVTIYASSADKALIASRVKAGGVPRAGDVPSEGPLLIPGMDVIDVTAIGDDMFALNHGVFVSQRSVLDDLGRIILSRTRPPHVRTTTLRHIPPNWNEMPNRTAPDYWAYPY